MNLGFPKSNIPLADKSPATLDWYKFFVRLVGAVETANSAITASATINKIGVVAADCTAGDVTVTPTAFPLTVIKTDASANNVTIGGITVNGDATFSWNTQYQAYTIDIVDGTYYAW